jgi:hypothetical protein
VLLVIHVRGLSPRSEQLNQIFIGAICRSEYSYHYTIDRYMRFDERSTSTRTISTLLGGILLSEVTVNCVASRYVRAPRRCVMAT